MLTARIWGSSTRSKCMGWWSLRVLCKWTSGSLLGARRRACMARPCCCAKFSSWWCSHRLGTLSHHMCPKCLLWLLQGRFCQWRLLHLHWSPYTRSTLVYSLWSLQSQRLRTPLNEPAPRSKAKTTKSSFLRWKFQLLSRMQSPSRSRWWSRRTSWKILST